MNDFSDLDRLAADLSKAGVTAGVRAVKLLEDTGRRVRDDARQFAPGAHGGPAKHYPKSITSGPVEIGAGTVSVEVGPEKGGQGSLGGIFEYGSVNNAPHAHLGPALDRSTPGFVKAVADLGGDVL